MNLTNEQQQDAEFKQQAEILDENFDKTQQEMMNQLRKPKSCCSMFTLSTAMPVFVFIDLLMSIYVYMLLKINVFKDFIHIVLLKR